MYKTDLTAPTLRSIALNYIECKSPKPPKPLQRAIQQLKRLENIVVTKPDKGTGVVIMNKSDYVNLLSQASINDTSKTDLGAKFLLRFRSSEKRV